MSEMDSYQVRIGPADSHEDETYTVMAANEQDATYRAGVCATLAHGAVVGDYVVKAVFSQAEFMAEAAHEAEEARRQQLHDEMIDDALARDGRWG